MNRTATRAHALYGTRVLVTGGAGFIGSHLVRRLVLDGAEVVVVDQSIGRLAADDHPWNFTFLDTDLRDSVLVADVVDSFVPQVLFHLASTPDARECFEQVEQSIHGNLMPTVNLLEAFRRCSDGLFVYGDSSKVYGNSDVPYRQSMSPDPRSSYAIAKSAGWDFCRLYASLYGTNVVSIRPTLIYGPEQAFNLITYVIDCVLTGKEAIRLDGGSQTRDPLYIDDAVGAYLAVARSGKLLSGKVINIGGGRECSVIDLVRTIERLMDSHLPILADAAKMRPTEMWRSYCDNAEAKELLGWEPVVDLETGLKRTIDAFVASRRAVQSLTPAKSA